MQPIAQHHQPHPLPPNLPIPAMAQAVVERGLGTPVLFILEAHKPLSSIILTSSLLLERLLLPLIGSNRWTTYRSILEDPSNCEALITEIELRLTRSAQPSDRNVND